MNCDTEAGRAAFFRVVEHHHELFKRLSEQVERQCWRERYAIPEDQLSAQLISTFAQGCLEVVGEDFDNLKQFITDEVALLVGKLREPSHVSYAPVSFLFGVTIGGEIRRPMDQIALQKKQESEGEAALDQLMCSPQKEILHKVATEALLALNHCSKKKEEETENILRRTGPREDKVWSNIFQITRREHVAILSSFTRSLVTEKSTQTCVDAYVKGKLLSDFAYSTEIYMWHASVPFLSSRMQLFFYDLAKRIDPVSILHSFPSLQTTVQEIAFREIFCSAGWRIMERLVHSQSRRTLHNEAKKLVALLETGLSPQQFARHQWDFQKHEFVPGAKEAQEQNKHRRQAHCDFTMHALSNFAKTVFPGDELAINTYFADVFLKEWDYSPEKYIQNGDDLTPRIKKMFSWYPCCFSNL